MASGAVKVPVLVLSAGPLLLHLCCWTYASTVFCVFVCYGFMVLLGSNLALHEVVKLAFERAQLDFALCFELLEHKCLTQHLEPL